MTTKTAYPAALPHLPLETSGGGGGLTDLGIYAVLGIAVVVAVAAFSKRLGVAAPVILVVVGVILSYLPGMPLVEVPHDWVLEWLLPPILYAAAASVPVGDFRRNIGTITRLSVLLVFVTAVVSGLLLHALLPGLPLAAAIALGAVISPPDAVAATSVGRRLGLPPRLLTVLEGEGLVNDATALVLLRTATAAASGGLLTPWETVSDFGFSVLVGVLVGLGVGIVTVAVRSRLNDPVLDTAVSILVPFVAFLPAESVHASGVLAVVVAGLYTGHASPAAFSAQDRISDRINWRTIQFLLENGVFLLIGLQIRGLVEHIDPDVLGVGDSILIGLVATAALVVIRFLRVGPLIFGLRLRAQHWPVLVGELGCGPGGAGRAHLQARLGRLRRQDCDLELGGDDGRTGRDRGGVEAQVALVARLRHRERGPGGVGCGGGVAVGVGHLRRPQRRRRVCRLRGGGPGAGEPGDSRQGHHRHQNGTYPSQSSHRRSHSAISSSSRWGKARGGLPALPTVRDRSRGCQ